MSDEPRVVSDEDAFEARIEGLESIFGPADPDMLEGAIPMAFGFELGGNPDIVSFSQHPAGRIHVTAELVGSDDFPPNRDGDYELAFAHPADQDGDRGIAAISALAHAAAETPIDHGDVMDLRESIDPDDTEAIRGLAFRRVGSFTFLGQEAHVLACIGITEDELVFALERGSCLELFERMPDGYFTTDTTRRSFLEGR